MTDFDAAATSAEISAATEHLLETAAILSDADLRAPSALPGWTRGHVLTHVARNADGLRNLLTTASTGVITPMYASNEAREAAIEAGSTRSAAEFLADLRESAERFADAYAAVRDDQWDTPVYRTPGAEPYPAHDVGGKRLAEVVVHHVDLDADYTPAHWPEAFIEFGLADSLVRFGTRDDFPALRLHVEESDAWYGIHADAEDEAILSVHGPHRALLAWLMGRSSGDGLVVEVPGDGRGTLPEIPNWG